MINTADGERILDELKKLAAFNSVKSQPGVTRMLFTDEEIEARNYIKELMREIGMAVEEDAIGNIYGTLAGRNPRLAPVWSGSHIDTVKNAGIYDGMTGVIAALEACRMIKENNISHERNIQVLVFTSEEPTRFGIGCVGSRAMAGHLSLEDTKKIYDDEGVSLYEELVRLGYTKKNFDTVIKKKGEVFASIELHIEQAPVLEQLRVPVGIVEGICAPSYIHVCVEGEQKHAGSTPMNVRKDPLTAACEIVLRLESLARTYGTTYSVATVGKLDVFPNASNVIPGKVLFTIDIRDVDEDTKQEITGNICGYMDVVGKIRGVRINYSIDTDDIPHRSDERVSSILERICKEMEVPCHRMISGAYHDSLLIAEFAPFSMIFVPSQEGISHDPKEYTRIEDIVTGTNVLCNALIDLANKEEL